MNQGIIDIASCASATMVGWRQKISKFHYLKHPKIVSKKRNLDQKLVILDLIFGRLISDFLAENPKANKNW